MVQISVNIISPQLSPKGKRATIFLLLSFGLLFLCYPINLLIGDGLFYNILAALILLNLVFWLLYYYFIDKDVVIGQIIFNHDQLIVDEISEKSIFKIADLSNITVSYHGYENEPFLVFYRPWMQSSTGHSNILSFNLDNKFYKYIFAIHNKTVWTLLNRRFEYYKNNGSDIKIEHKQLFVKF